MNPLFESRRNEKEVVAITALMFEIWVTQNCHRLLRLRGRSNKCVLGKEYSPFAASVLHDVLQVSDENTSWRRCGTRRAGVHAREICVEIGKVYGCDKFSFLSHWSCVFLPQVLPPGSGWLAVERCQAHLNEFQRVTSPTVQESWNVV